MSAASFGTMNRLTVIPQQEEYVVTVRRHGRARPGHPRLGNKQGVDARHEAGHDGAWSELTENVRQKPLINY
jgi:hypothetical protein